MPKMLSGSASVPQRPCTPAAQEEEPEVSEDTRPCVVSESFEVRVTDIGPHRAVCRHLGRETWSHVLSAPVTHMAIGGGFVAISTDGDIRALELSSGREALSSVSSVSVLVLDSCGNMLVVGKDFSLSVWNLASGACVVRTTLQHIAKPVDVMSVGVKPQTSEPVVRLRDGRLFAFHRTANSWLSVAHRSSGESAKESFKTEFRERGPGKEIGGCFRAEGELLAAAHLGDPQQFQESLKELVDVPTLIHWCEALLPGNSLALSMERMGLVGQALLQGIVLPALVEKGALDVHAEVYERFISPSSVAVTSVF